MRSVEEYSSNALKMLTMLNVTDYQPVYMSTNTTVLSDDPSVALPLLTINRWIMMQNKVEGGSVWFNQSWVDYREGFGSPDGIDNYWIGLDKIYRLQQRGNLRLRIEVILTTQSIDSGFSSTEEPSIKFVAETEKRKGEIFPFPPFPILAVLPSSFYQ